MANYTFKTNINCGSCIRAVTPILSKTAGITNWSVDTDNPDKILQVETSLSPEEIQQLVKRVGFEATVTQK
jgi:copper chaperone